MWQRDRRANRSVQRNVAPCVEPPPLIVYFGHSHAVAVGSCALLLRQIVVRPGIIVVDVWAVKPSKRNLQARIVRSNPEAARCAVAARVDRGGRGEGERERKVGVGGAQKRGERRGKNEKGRLSKSILGLSSHVITFFLRPQRTITSACYSSCAPPLGHQEAQSSGQCWPRRGLQQILHLGRSQGARSLAHRYCRPQRQRTTPQL